MTVKPTYKALEQRVKDLEQRVSEYTQTEASLKENQNVLRAAIENLPAEQKDTLMLKLEAGLDLQTIADVTGVNRETAKSRLRYAVKKMKQVMTGLELSQEI